MIEEIRRGVIEYLTGKHCVLYGQAFEISSEDGIKETVEWLTEEVISILAAMDRVRDHESAV